MALRPEASERRCLVTREVKEPDRMIRFVLDPAGRVVPDVDGRLPGRGMWLSADRNVLNKAVAANLFARAARARVQVEADLAAQVERLLVGRALDCLGLARRAGQVAMGFDQVRACLRSSAAAVLIAAADSAVDGRRKLRRLASDLPVITAFSKAELGAALGREGVVHVAVAPGGLARRLINDVRRLAGFRADALALPAPGTTRLLTELEGTTERS
ncbi:MAG TPA: RNA-binding protein [Geminicoccaceae bacterium]|jgi:predicted RNA-binding protein YlxR (DUF448 family)|nr:RNA-binding protein [Geminicoccaceae bacterium]HZA67609.1 RNA-binding protein [Geminicoccaceae bacterium]